MKYREGLFFGALWLIAGGLLLLPTMDKRPIKLVQSSASATNFFRSWTTKQWEDFSLDHEWIDPSFADSRIYRGHKIYKVSFSPGGYNIDFVKLGMIVRDLHKRLVIDGECTSACTFMADIALDQTCITKWAYFQYHKSSNEDIVPLYSDFAYNYVLHKGGFPSFSSGKLVLMPYTVAAQHWKTCNFRAMIGKL